MKAKCSTWHQINSLQDSRHAKMTWNAVKNYVWLNPHNACDCQLAERGGSSRSALILIVCTVAGCNPRSGDVWENVGFHLSATKPWWNNPCFMVSLGIWNWRSLSTATSRKAVLLSFCWTPREITKTTLTRQHLQRTKHPTEFLIIYISFSFIVTKKMFRPSKELLEKESVESEAKPE